MSRVISLIVLLCCVCCAEWMHASIVANFDTAITTNDAVLSYSFLNATSSNCELSVNMNRNSDTSSFTFAVDKLTASLNQQYVTIPNLILFGSYSLVFMQTVPAGIQVTIGIKCSNGNMNSNPDSMRIFNFIEGKRQLVDSGAIPRNADSIQYSFKTIENTNYQSSLGFRFGGLVSDGITNIGPFQPFFGPYQFNYVLAKNSIGGAKEYLRLTLPNVIPTFENKYQLRLSNSLAPTSFESMGYSTLYSFVIDVMGNPVSYQSLLEYHFTDSNSFQDVTGRQIYILPNTATFVCSQDGYNYTIATSLSTDSSGSTIRSGDLSKCHFVSIITKTTDTKPVDPKSLATELSDGDYGRTDVISSKTYFKIMVPSGFTLDTTAAQGLDCTGSARISLEDENSLVLYSADIVYDPNHPFANNRWKYVNSANTRFLYIAVENLQLSTSIVVAPTLRAPRPPRK